MRTEDFDYDLPSGLIAQEPLSQRDASRLLVLDRGSGQIDHRGFADLIDYLRPEDVLVLNETRVLPARLKGAKDETGGAVEVLLLRQRYGTTWECLVRPGRRVKPGTRIVFGDGDLSGLVVDVLDDLGGRLIQFTGSERELMEAVHRLGEMPLPPYITKPIDDPERYQTVFARDERSAAAPTAGLHFTPELLEQIRAQGTRVEHVELDVGLDTFRPVAEDRPQDHRMHSEHFRVPPRAADAVNEAKRRGGRVFAVGTTTTRALESAWDLKSEEIVAQERATDLFILPGYRFRAVDVMVTNFHTPRSTLLMMVSAFAGRELVMRAYEDAIERRYRFLSFGDAMLIL